MNPKRGDVREDGWRFWKRSGTKEHWFSPEDYDAKAKKALESQRAHYERNKEAVKKKTKAYKEKKKPAVKKKTKAYKEKKKPAPKPKPLRYTYDWMVRVIEDNIPEEDTRRPDRVLMGFRFEVSSVGLYLVVFPSWVARCAFMRRKDESGQSKNLITEIFLQYINPASLDIYFTDNRSAWEVSLEFVSLQMMNDLQESIAGLLLSSLYQDDFNFYKINPKYPNPEIEESGDLSLILRQRFDPLFDAPLSSFSDVTSPLHPKTDLF
jgi:hypothetical protein